MREKSNFYQDPLQDQQEKHQYIINVNKIIKICKIIKWLKNFE